MFPWSTEVLSVEGFVVSMSGILVGTLFTIAVYEVVVSPGEIVVWELVSG